MPLLYLAIPLVYPIILLYPQVLTLLQGRPASKAKAWLVCCLRPNDVGQADRVRLGTARGGMLQN